jgi:lysophospholipase L1-like esterase
MQALKAHLLANAPPTSSLPPLHPAPPSIRWSGPLNDQFTLPPTTLPNGVIYPITHTSIGGPIRDRLATLPGNPTLSGYPCLSIARPYTCRGFQRSVSSRTPHRIKTDAPVIEFTGVVFDSSFATPMLIVDGQLVPPTAFSGSRGSPGGGWNAGTLVVDFGTRAMRDIWIETLTYLAYIKIDASDTLLPANDASEPQITVVGDSYLQTVTKTFPFDGAIAQEIGARLGIRKVATDALGGSGYYNTSSNLGNLNDRLPAHAADNSIVYVVMAGLNDYADVAGWPTRSDFERSVYDYIAHLRAAQPKALIVVTAPFCPVPPRSDTLWVANAATNTSGLGDYQYMAGLHKDAVQKIAGPWVYIDVLMGGGWLNSSGNTGDVTGLQWFTGGNLTAGVQGGGGGFGGIKAVPIVSGGQYSRGPRMFATGGTGDGLLLSGAIDSTGVLTSINIASMGSGYTDGAGLPTITIDPEYAITPAILGSPVLSQGINPGSGADYPFLGPPGADLNNIYRYLWEDKTHPSVLGAEYLGKRLAQNIYQAVMAL